MIYLFGSTGMLGNYVRIVLSKKFEVKCITRNDYDILKDDWNKLNTLLTNINKNDVIVNCAGIIPQKINSDEFKNYIKLNTLFPHKLSHISEKYSAKLIHITTDCVFDGKIGNYYENNIHNSNDIYGITKSLGEPENCCVIRTSIIGHETKGKRNLLEWVLSNKNKTIYGYTNHFWNGLTCLTLTNTINKIIEKNLFWKGVKHIFSPNIVNKYELCCIINNIYNLNINIEKKIDSNCINRILKSDYEIDFDICDIQTQLLKQYEFYLKYE